MKSMRINIGYGFIAITIIRLLGLFKLDRLRRFSRFLGPKLLSKNKRTTDAIEKNLQLCLPKLSAEERNSFSRQRLARMCQTLFEMSHIWTKSPKTIQAYLMPQYDNSVFEAEVKSSNGIIVLVPHIGNWEMMNVYLSQFRTLTAMYRPLKDRALDTFIQQARQRFNSVLVPTNSKGIMQIMRALKSSGMVAFLPDQVPEVDNGGVFAPLFGHQAYTMTLAHKLALKTKAKVFVGVAYQCDQGFSVSIKTMAEEFYQQDAEVAASCLNQAIEQAILHQPIQNQWEYKRYRVQPNEQQSLYKK